MTKHDDANITYGDIKEDAALDAWFRQKIITTIRNCFFVYLAVALPVLGALGTVGGWWASGLTADVKTILRTQVNIESTQLLNSQRMGRLESYHISDSGD